MKNLQMIEIKYLAPTNTKGARIKLIDTRFKVSEILNYDYFSDLFNQSIKHLSDKGFNVIFKSYDELNQKYYVFIDNFEPINQILTSVR